VESGGELPSYKQQLLSYLNDLLKKRECLEAIGENKIKEWIGSVERGTP
jgi:hypothetical protein